VLGDTCGWLYILAAKVLTYLIREPARTLASHPTAANRRGAVAESG
jgi:hypothetical protein